MENDDFGMQWLQKEACFVPLTMEEVEKIVQSGSF
jgi:hypothetical protein